MVREAGGHPVQLVGRDPEALVRALDGCRAVVHLAQIGAERGGQTYEAVNVGYTERVLEDCRHAGVPRVVYFSGLGVARYGMSPRCSNDYFLSKLAAETILFRSGLEGVVFRPSFVVGPGDAFVPAVLRAMDGGRGGAAGRRLLPHAADRRRGRRACVLAAVERPRGRLPERLRPRRARAGSLRGAPRAAGAGRPRAGPEGRPARARGPDRGGGPPGPRRRLPGDAARRARLPALRRGLRPRPPRGSPRPAARRRSTKPSRRPCARREGPRLPAPAPRASRRTWPSSAPACPRSPPPLELSRRGARVAVLGAASADERPRGLGLALLGPGRPYARVARALGRSEARLVWAAGCENHLRLRALVDEARRDCGYAPRGSFLLAADRAEAGELAESEDMLRDDGFPGEFLDHYMLETRFDLSGFPGAYWAAEDAEVDAALLLGASGSGRWPPGSPSCPAPSGRWLAEASVVSVETEDWRRPRGRGARGHGRGGGRAPPRAAAAPAAGGARSSPHGPAGGGGPAHRRPNRRRPRRLAGRGGGDPAVPGSARPGISPRTPLAGLRHAHPRRARLRPPLGRGGRGVSGRPAARGPAPRPPARGGLRLRRALARLRLRRGALGGGRAPDRERIRPPSPLRVTRSPASV